MSCPTWRCGRTWSPSTGIMLPLSTTPKSSRRKTGTKVNLKSRHTCATFGQEFQYDNKSFYPVFTATCQEDEKWSSETIPHQCGCEYFNLRQVNLNPQGLGVSRHLSHRPSTPWKYLGTRPILPLTTKQLTISVMLASHIISLPVTSHKTHIS